MAKTYNGRFNLPKQPSSGKGWLFLGAVLIIFGEIPGLVLGVLSLGKYSKCRKEKKLHERFLRCCAVIGKRAKASVRELARALDQSVADMRKDLQSMIAKGYFGNEAYLDMDGGQLILSDDVQGGRFENWKDAVLDLVHSIRDDFFASDSEKEPQPEQSSFESAEPPKAEPVHEQAAPADARKTYMDELEKTLSELYQLNEQIEDEGVSRRIDRIGELTGGIFRAVIENPDRENDVRKFMNYYLPTTLKLLKTYDLMENQSYQGENIKESRKKIEGVLDLLIETYEKQLDRLFKNDALDIATDIDVLETMMAGDGFTSKGQMPM